MKRLTAALLALLLGFSLLAGCGEKAQQEAPPARYSATHAVLEYYADVASACVWGDKLCYLSGLAEEPTLFTLYLADPETGETQPLEAFTRLQRERLDSGESAYQLAQAAAAPDGTLRLLASLPEEQDDFVSLKTWLLSLDSQGNLLDRLPLSVDPLNFWTQQRMVCDGTGVCYLLDGTKGLWLADADLTEAKKSPHHFDALVPLADGRVGRSPTLRRSGPFVLLTPRPAGRGKGRPSPPLPSVWSPAGFTPARGIMTFSVPPACPSMAAG